MSQTPIFDQLATDYALRGKSYESMTKPIPTELPKRQRPYVKPSSTAPVAVPLSVLQAVTAEVIDRDTIALPVVKPSSERKPA